MKKLLPLDLLKAIKYGVFPELPLRNYKMTQDMGSKSNGIVLYGHLSRGFKHISLLYWHR
jgi:hypothetical protein